jgi:nucleoside-diphosphate-sugar epimerase
LGEKSIIITGNNGFVGSNLSMYIKGKKIIGVSRRPKENEVNYEQLNITLLNSTEAFIHLAGKAHDLKNTYEEQEYFNINTELTKRLFNLFLESDCEVFVYMSSVKAISDSLDVILKENKSPNPQTAYGKSKLAAESYILSKKTSIDKRVYILRPCMIHGPNNKGNLNLLYTLVSKRIPWVLGLYENKRSYCSIDNLSFIINELIINKKIPTGIYNVADDLPLSTNQVISLISKSVNSNPLIWKTPKILIKYLAILGDKIYLPLNSERLKKLTESYVVCNKKIVQAIDKNLPTSSEKGLLKTFESFKKEKFNIILDSKM